MNTLCQWGILHPLIIPSHTGLMNPSLLVDNDKMRINFVTPSDPIWDTLTENERVENGLPSKFQYRIRSVYHVILLGLGLGK